MLKINASSIRGYLFSLSLAILVYFFYSLVVNNEEKFFVLPIEIRYPDKFVATYPSTSSVNVAVRGSPTSLARVTKEDMRSYVDLSGAQEPGIVTRPIEIERFGVFSQMNNVEIVLEPNAIEVNLENKVTKQVSIDPSFENSSPRGYLFKGYRTVPVRVEISGPSSILDDISKIKTETIDLSLYKQSLSRKVQLMVPEYVSFVTKDTEAVRIDIEIEEVKIVETFRNLSIEVRNLQEGYKVTNINTRGEIVVQGAQLAVENFRPILYVDLSTVRSRTRLTVPVQADLAPNIELVSLLPEDVLVNILRDENYNEQLEDNAPTSVPVPLLEPSEEDLQDDTSTTYDDLRIVPKVPLAPLLKDFNE